jgi:hypothetical protein
MPSFAATCPGVNEALKSSLNELFADLFEKVATEPGS